MGNATQTKQETQTSIHPDPRESLLHRLRCPVADSVNFLKLVSSLKSLPNTFFGPTQEEQAILYAAVRLLLGNTSNDPNNLEEKINNNELFRREDDPVKAFQQKLIETVKALQGYCDTILKERAKDKPEYIFDVRNILIALQEYCKKHNNNPDFDLNNALTVTSAALESDENLTKILANPYSVSAINFGENQGM